MRILHIPRPFVSAKFPPRLTRLALGTTLLLGCPGIPGLSGVTRTTVEASSPVVSEDGTQRCITKRVTAKTCLSETSTTCVPASTQVQTACELVAKHTP